MRSSRFLTDLAPIPAFETVPRWSTKDAIDGHNLTLRRAKSGEGVMVYRPGFVTKALERITQPDQAHFFWSGTSLPVTAAHCWRSRLNLVDRCAGVRDVREHQVCDSRRCVLFGRDCVGSRGIT